MKRQGHSTAFYIETLLLIVVMIVILMVLTGVFGYASSESVRAKRLTEAVTVAESTAEALASAGELEEAAQMVALENVELTKDAAEETLQGYYIWERTARLEKDGIYRVEITRMMPDDEICEQMIRIYYEEDEEPVYTLDTARYLPEGEEADQL